MLTAGMMPSLLVPRPQPQTILISFLVIFPLIYFTAVLIAALMCQVLKHLALFPFDQLMQLALPRSGVRGKRIYTTYIFVYNL